MIKGEKKEISTISPPSGWRYPGFREVWEYRSLIWLFAKRGFISQYRQMSLGPFWSILKPIIDMVIFTFVFGRVANLPSEEIPYSIFAYCALISWSYFSEITKTTSGSLVNELYLISKVYFPRMVIPISSLVSRLFDLGVSVLLLLIMMGVYNIEYRWNILVFPLFLLISMSLGLGIGLWMAAIAVRFRDIKNVTLYGMQVMKFATPVLYSSLLIPEKYLFLYQLNPMYWVVQGFRWCFLGASLHLNFQFIISLILSFAVLISGIFVFWRNERTIVDWL